MMRALPVSLAFALLSVLSGSQGCSCAPERFDGQVAALDVTLANEDGVLTIRRDDAELLSASLLDVAVRSGDAIYDAQFGMFDIVDLAEEEWRSPTQARISEVIRPTDAGAEKVGFELLRDGVPMIVGSVGQSEDRWITLGVSQAIDPNVEDPPPAPNRWRLSFSCAPDDHFAGLGGHTHDVDFRGQRVPLWVSEQGVGKTDNNELPELWQVLGRRHTTHTPMPAFVTSRGTAVVVESYAYAIFDLCATDENKVELEVWDPAGIKLHLFDGPTPLEALGRMTNFVGRPRMPPAWAFAPWNDAIFGEDNVRDFAQFLRDNEIPSSAIWSEDWRGGNDSGDLYRLEEDWDLDRELYPNYEQLASDLRALGIAPQVYFNTFLTITGDVYEEVTDNGWAIEHENGDVYLFDGVDASFSPTGLLDLTDDGALDFMRGKLQTAIDLGSRGWMADYAEWMPVQRAVLASGEDPALVHNRYPVLWAELNAEVTEGSDADEGVIAFHRSAHLFSQKYTTIMWAGDQRTSFMADDGLPTVVPMGLGLSSVGFPFYAHDIAGYQSSTNDPVSKELFFRWTELGAFTPVMRTHHGTHARFNHNLQTDAETTAHYKRYAELHVRLFPYVRALADDAVFNGRPLWIALGLMYPDDETAWGLLDEYLYGDALLVAPVVTEGATSRDVYFPAGRWTPLLAGGTAVEGPTTESVDAPLEEIPVFLRAGGIVPLTTNTPQTLFEDVPGVAGLESTEGDRDVYVGLGKEGLFSETSGARYELVGEGTGLGDLVPDGDGAVTVVGNGALDGDGWTLQLAGHPDERTTRVFLR
jgi:alpha-glucosidase